MKINRFFCLIITLLMSQYSLGQTLNKVLRGIVVQQELGGRTPIEDASVYILGVDETMTDSKGFFELNLNQCHDCEVGKSTLKIIVNSSYGNKEYDYNVPFSPSKVPIKIEIPANNRITVSGIIKDNNSGKFISGIETSLILPGYDIPPTKTTDKFGRFNFVVKSTGDLGAVQLVFKDSKQGKYQDKEEIVMITKTPVPLKIFMDKCTNCGEKYDIDVYKGTYYNPYKSKVKIEKGDDVIIKASGTIKVGTFVGNSTPIGLERGVFGLSLSDYNYFKNQNHAALCFRLGEGDSWKFYDKESKFNVQEDGYIEFMINDNIQTDNSGAYKIEVTVIR